MIDQTIPSLVVSLTRSISFDTNLYFMPIFVCTSFGVEVFDIVQAVVLGLVDTRGNLQISVWEKFPLVQTEVIGRVITFEAVIE